MHIGVYFEEPQCDHEATQGNVCRAAAELGH